MVYNQCIQIQTGISLPNSNVQMDINCRVQIKKEGITSHIIQRTTTTMFSLYYVHTDLLLDYVEARNQAI